MGNKGSVWHHIIQVVVENYQTYNFNHVKYNWYIALHASFLFKENDKQLSEKKEKNLKHIYWLGYNQPNFEKIAALKFWY